MQHFRLTECDSSSSARTGVLSTAHGDIQTPVFMPVGTLGSIKGITPAQAQDTGAQIILSNAFHLSLRPGVETVAEHGGLHRFMGWQKPILTDSGGYQVFSLKDHMKLTESGVMFRSPIDGAKIEFTPESVVDIQRGLGVDIMMPLDECVQSDADEARISKSVDLTVRWLQRASERWKKSGSDTKQLLFGIIQGGMYETQRIRSAELTTGIELPGYAIGGLSVGEPQEVMMQMIETVTPLIPLDKPRYLMGVGYPDDLILSIERGVDMFDCVLPTRNGRNGNAFTINGSISIRNAAYKADVNPIDNKCMCYTCQNFSKSYLRHLFMSGEMLGPTLLSLHNIQFYIKFIDNIRNAIRQGTFQTYKKEFFNSYQRKVEK